MHAKIVLKILGVKTANELGEVMAAVGLVSKSSSIHAFKG
jgi:hydroxymethylglutaryl-CoA reductase